MKGNIGLITILTDDLLRLVEFYQDILGFKRIFESETYVEFGNEGVRFAICARSVMEKMTDHPSYKEERKGQTFELAFPCDSSEQVDATYDEIIARGATPIKSPHDTPWGRRTAIFADPDGNIHELFGPEE